MKPLNPKSLAALAGAAIAAVILVQARPAARADQQPSSWDPGETDAWADADAADRYRELDDQTRQVADRLTRKIALADSLARGERTLDEVATRFRELNGPDRAAYRSLAREYPAAGDEELAYRQAIGFVRMAVKADRTRPATILPRLEADLARRFPPAGA